MTEQHSGNLSQVRPLGIVVGGSLSGGVDVKLDAGASVEELQAGAFVTIQGERHRFFGMISDVSLGATDARLRTAPPDVSDPFIARVLSGTAAFGEFKVKPRLLLPAVAGDDGEIAPARTVPPHFARAFRASEADVATVFGSEDGRHFWVGSPLDMETRGLPGHGDVCAAQQRRVRQERHGQEFFDAPAAGGHPPEDQRRQPHL